MPLHGPIHIADEQQVRDRKGGARGRGFRGGAAIIRQVRWSTRPILRRLVEREIIGWSVSCWDSPGIVVDRALDALEIKVRESGKIVPNLKAEKFFMATKTPTTSREISLSTTATKTPPRLESDQLVHMFFQEWAPLFPILHRPTFLKLYADYLARPDGVAGQQSIAQIHLVFSIAAVSAEVTLFEIA